MLREMKAYGEALGRGDDLVYRHLNVHGYWGLGGGKMSKSVGNVVEALSSRTSTGTTPSATSSCARWCSAPTPTSRRKRSSAGSTPISRTTSATWGPAPPP